MSETAARLEFGVVARGIARTCREQWRLLLAGGVIVFVPLGFVEALDATLQDRDLDRLDELAFLGVVAVAFGHAAAALLGEVFYSGVVASGVSEARGGGHHTLGGIARSVPYGRLAIVDVAFALIAGVGLLLGVLPGIVFFVWFVLAGPLVKIERRRPVDALRRSRELVRGSFWRVLVLVVPLELGTEALAGLAAAACHALGDSLWTEWAGSALGAIITTPLWAAAIVVLTYELIALRGPGRPDDAPQA